MLGPLNVDMIVHGTSKVDIKDIGEWIGESSVSVLMAGAVGYFIGISRALGHEIHAISVVGDDPLGMLVLDSLRRIDVPCTLVDTQPGKATAIAIYMLLFGSNKRPLTYQNPSHDLWPLTFRQEHHDAIKTSDWFHHGGYLHFQPAWHGEIVNMFTTAKQHGIGTSLDPQFPLVPYNPPWIRALEKILPLVDILFVDRTEACNLVDARDPERALDELVTRGPKLVVVKLGEEGSIMATKEQIIKLPASKVENIVDSIGAGDSFDAGFIDAWLRKETPRECLVNATNIAARTLAHPGGRLDT